MGIRVKLLNISSSVKVQSIDYGFYLEKQNMIFHRLPLGLARTLPGLAIRCHLFNIGPAYHLGWNLGATNMMKSYNAGLSQLTGLIQERRENSLGLEIILKTSLNETTLNQKLVDVGFAIICLQETRLHSSN